MNVRCVGMMMESSREKPINQHESDITCKRVSRQKGFQTSAYYELKLFTSKLSTTDY